MEWWIWPWLTWEESVQLHPDARYKLQPGKVCSEWFNLASLDPDLESKAAHGHQMMRRPWPISEKKKRKTKTVIFISQNLFLHDIFRCTEINSCVFVALFLPLNFSSIFIAFVISLAIPKGPADVYQRKFICIYLFDNLKKIFFLLFLISKKYAGFVLVV